MLARLPNTKFRSDSSGQREARQAWVKLADKAFRTCSAVGHHDLSMGSAQGTWEGA